MISERPIHQAYDGSTATIRALRAWGWDELINLGYFPLLELALLPLGMDRFQRRLARKAIALLRPLPGETILDVGCGRGWTTREIARRGARAMGIDRLREHIEEARRRFEGSGSVRYVTGDASDLARVASDRGIREGSVEGILCLEAAFQFGSEGRREFLAQAFRLLKPAGRLVLVDFTWSDDHPERIADLDPDRYVRDTWQFDQFEPLERYRERAKSIGFVERALLDWSTPVIGRFCALCGLLTALGRYATLRALFIRLRPGLADLALPEWRLLREVVLAHDRVRRTTRYVALVLGKP